MEFNSDSWKRIFEIVLDYSPKVAVALVTLAVGWVMVKITVKIIHTSMEKRNVDISLRRFIESFLGLALKAILLVIVAGTLGLKTASLIALLGAAGLAVGLALQGSLSNFAGGVLILLFRPFQVHDLIEAGGIVGEVREITILNTVLVTPDNKTAYIPNSSLVSGALVNYTETPNRRVDVVVGISYSDDIAKARRICEDVVSKKEYVLSEPRYEILVESLGDNSVNILVRTWVANENYWAAYFGIQEAVKNAFDRDGISIPFPQRDIHVYQEAASLEQNAAS